jgi:hypothetical protein
MKNDLSRYRKIIWTGCLTIGLIYFFIMPASTATTDDPMWIGIVTAEGYLAPLAVFQEGKWQDKWINHYSKKLNSEFIVDNLKNIKFLNVNMPKSWIYYLKGFNSQVFNVYDLVGSGNEYNSGAFTTNLVPILKEEKYNRFVHGIALNKSINVQFEQKITAKAQNYWMLKEFINQEFDTSEKQEIFRNQLFADARNTGAEEKQPFHKLSDLQRRKEKLKLDIFRIGNCEDPFIYHFYAIKNYNIPNSSIIDLTITDMSGWIFIRNSEIFLRNKLIHVQGHDYMHSSFEKGLGFFSMDKYILWIGVSSGYESHRYIIYKINNQNIERVFLGGGGGV